MEIEFKPILVTPCNVFLVECPANFDSQLRRYDHPLISKLMIDYFDCAFRAVSLDRLGTILQQGIDVTPTNAVIYAHMVDKALAYGEWPKVLLALKHDSLKRTFREISADSSEEEIETVRSEYPTILRSVDGFKLWCSRLAESDPKVTGEYEIAYARWIPGDPWVALKAVFILFRPEDISALQETLMRWKVEESPRTQL